MIYEEILRQLGPEWRQITCAYSWPEMSRPQWILTRLLIHGLVEVDTTDGLKNQVSFELGGVRSSDGDPTFHYVSLVPKTPNRTRPLRLTAAGIKLRNRIIRRKK